MQYRPVGSAASRTFGTRGNTGTHDGWPASTIRHADTNERWGQCTNVQVKRLGRAQVRRFVKPGITECRAEDDRLLYNAPMSLAVTSGTGEATNCLFT